jgi:hypothetical protein
MTRRGSFPTLALTVCLLVGTGCGPIVADQTHAEPVVTFTDLPRGWSVPSVGADCTALSWRYPPSATGWADAANFTGDRVAVSAILLGRQCAPSARNTPAAPGRTSGYRRLNPLLRLAAPTRIGHLEGSSNAVQYRFTQRLTGGCRLDLRVSFAQRPSRRQLTTAQRVLDGIRVARRYRCTP